MCAKIYSVFFSPTQCSKIVAQTVSNDLSQSLGLPIHAIDWTPPAGRPCIPSTLEREDVLVLAYPVYAGRVPAIIAPLIRALRGAGTPAIALAIYGNRDFDDALLEACDLLREGGFIPLAAGAFVGEHSYSRKVGAGRPDPADLSTAVRFAQQAAKKLQENNCTTAEPTGARPYKKLEPAPDMRPLTTEDCNGCGICATLCPAGVIDLTNPASVSEGCLRCCACVKACPKHAKHFPHPPMLAFQAFLETNCMERKEPALFL